MNIFFLSLVPQEIAELSCDQHVIKIQLEIAQMLYTAWYYANQEQYVREHAPYTKNGSQRGYKPAHKKHPMTMWISSSPRNYMFACDIGLALSKEYTKRYGKIHTCEEHLRWLKDNVPPHFDEHISDTAYYSVQGIPECMPAAYHCPDVIDAYRKYYINDKASFARYKTGTPSFMQGIKV
tara:strand:+ start:920 stop:1459 length:540 start_codon:yes stop_codon:yes gene_type:complete